MGAPLRSSSISEPRASGSSGPLRQHRSQVGTSPLNDLDDEELEDVEITSSRPMLFGLEIDPNVVGEGSGKPLWRREFDGIGVEGEEVFSLVNRKGKKPDRTPVRSGNSHAMGEGGERELLSPSRRPLKSTIDEVDALLVDGYGDDDDPERDSRDQPRTSIASTSTVGYEAQEVNPRRTLYSL